MKYFLFFTLTATIFYSANAQVASDQLKPYLDKIAQDEKEKQQQQILDQEKAAQAIQKGTVQVPAINARKISEMGEQESYKKSKDSQKNSEEYYENMYLNEMNKYRKIERSKPYIKNGVVYFSYGLGTPFVICSPKHVCDVQFEAGESITNIQIGDATRWVINVKNSDGQNEAHVFLKPIISGINTNLIISTEKRQYNFNLKSQKKKYFGKVAFAYQNNEQKLLTIYTDIPNESKYYYYIRGDKTNWTPTEIRTDGRKTFIQLPNKFLNSPDFPTVYSLDSDGSESQVNKRIYKNWIIVDVMLDQGELKSGVGIHQNKVVFTRKGTFGVLSKAFSNN